MSTPTDSGSNILLDHPLGNVSSIAKKNKLPVYSIFSSLETFLPLLSSFP